MQHGDRSSGRNLQSEGEEETKMAMTRNEMIDAHANLVLAQMQIEVKRAHEHNYKVYRFHAHGMGQQRRFNKQHKETSK